MSQLLTDTTNLRSAGYDESTIEEMDSRNQLIHRFLNSPVGDHLRSLDDGEAEEASGGTLLSVDQIRDEISDAAPSSFLFPLGFLPIWSSIGGNVIMFNLNDGGFYWVDHEGFLDDGTMFFYGTLNKVDFDETNATQGMFHLSGDPPPEFLDNLRGGVFEDQLDSLD